MAVTFDRIATTTLSSATASVTFSSISGSYTDLVLIINDKISTGEEGGWVQLNGDTGTNYSLTVMTGNGTSATSGRYTNTSTPYISNTNATDFNTQIVHFMNYSNTTTYKTFLARSSMPARLVTANVGLWRSTSAITSIKIGVSGSVNYVTGSTFTLYGILAA